MFWENGLYVHRGMIDVAFRVVKEPVTTTEGVQLDIQWYNTQYKKFLDLYESVLITPIEANNYRLIIED